MLFRNCWYNTRKLSMAIGTRQLPGQLLHTAHTTAAQSEKVVVHPKKPITGTKGFLFSQSRSNEGSLHTPTTNCCNNYTCYNKFTPMLHLNM